MRSFIFKEEYLDALEGNLNLLYAVVLFGLKGERAESLIGNKTYRKVCAMIAMDNREMFGYLFTTEDEKDYICWRNETYPNVSKMESTLTYREFFSLLDEHGEQSIISTLEAMDAYKKILKHKSAYRTIKVWLKRQEQWNKDKCQPTKR